MISNSHMKDVNRTRELLVQGDPLLRQMSVIQLNQDMFRYTRDVILIPKLRKIWLCDSNSMVSLLGSSEKILHDILKNTLMLLRATKSSTRTNFRLLTIKLMEEHVFVFSG